MPNIRGFEAPGGIGLNPTEIGVDAVAGAARRVGTFYNQFAGATAELGNEKAQMWRTLGNEAGTSIRDAGSAALQYEEHQQLSHGVSTAASLKLDLTQKYNDALKNADPNDPSFVGKFNEEVVQPALNNFKSAFSTERTQAWADAEAKEIKNHFITKGSADLSTLAGVAVHNNIRNSATNWSNTASTDPSSVPFLLAGVDHSINHLVDSSPNLSAADSIRAKLDLTDATKAAIVKSGAQGAIAKSPNPEATADQWIKKYPDYINGDEAKNLAANARSQIRAQNYDYEMNRRRQKEVTQDRSNEATADYLVKIRSQDPRLANDPTAKSVLNDPNLTKQDKNNLLNYIDRQNKPETEARLSQQTFVGLLRDLRAPDADPDKIMQKAWDARVMDPGKLGSLNERDFNQFRNEVVARKTPEGADLERDRAAFFKNYAAAISGQGAQYQPGIGDPKVYNAEMDARRVETDLRRKGLDPHLAYDPSSEYFLGKPERVAKWVGSMQSDLHGQSPVPEANKLSARPGVPDSLRGIADLSYSAKRKQWRDNASGKIYGVDGAEVK